MEKLPIPEIGLGTWELRGHECTKVVKLALELGYRHIDTAQDYDNHQAVHKGMAGFDRSQLYLTSKIELEEAESVEKACERALKELGTDYLDCYLIHWPVRTLPMGEIFRAMEKLARQGKVRQAGVSNFNVHHLEDLKKEGLTPAINQVEFHPYLYQKELWEYCKRHKIQLVAYRPLGKGKLLKEPLLAQIGHPHNKSAAQVVLRWLVQKGIPAIPKASSEKHLRDNLAIFDFSLTEEEMAALDALNKNIRFCQPDHPEFQY